MPLPDLAFSHVGLFVADPERASAFWERALGFVCTDRGTLDGRAIVFLSRDPAEHHQIVFVARGDLPPAAAAVNQLSFRLGSLEDLQAMTPRLEAEGATELRPVMHGNAWSVYFRDPEGHRVELFVDSPWYVAQPCREPLDLRRPAAAIRAETEAWCRAQPSFRPASAFRAEVAAKLAARADG